MRAPLLALAAVAATAAPALADPVHGTAWIAPPPHCGGAYLPTDRAAPRSSPAAGRKIIIRPGGENSARTPKAIVVTGKDGGFDAELPAGTYCVVLDDKLAKPRKGDRYHPLACQVAEWKTCDAVITVPLARPLAITRQTPCFGVCYQGPMPP